MTALLLGFVCAATAAADSAGGVQWTPPAGWKSMGARPMRAATYAVPAAAGDKESGECAVFYFGPGQGGGVQANIDRWVSQFRGPDGKPLTKAGKTSQQTIHGLNVTTVEVAGAYAAGAGPMMQPTTPKPGYRLLGAIVQAPQGNVFFKFTGPAKTVAAGQPAFEKLLQSLRK